MVTNEVLFLHIFLVISYLYLFISSIKFPLSQITYLLAFSRFPRQQLFLPGRGRGSGNRGPGGLPIVWRRLGGWATNLHGCSKWREMEMEMETGGVCCAEGKGHIGHILVIFLQCCREETLHTKLLWCAIFLTWIRACYNIGLETSSRKHKVKLMFKV